MQSILTPVYNNNRLESLWIQDTEVSLSRLWVNDMPAAHLQHFADYAQKCFSISEPIPDGYGYNLKPNHWTWYTTKEEDIVELIFHGMVNNEDKIIPKNIPLFLKVLGLKIFIFRTFNVDIENYKTCRLYLNDRELDDDDYALSDYGVKESDIISFNFISKTDSGRTNDQQSEGEPISNFNTFISSIPDKVGLVCLIVTEFSQQFFYGSGCLINKDHIITNDHVLAKRGKNQDKLPIIKRNKINNYPEIYKKDGQNFIEGDQALFFYEGFNGNISIPLDEVVYSSQRPASGRINTKELDFCIVRLAVGPEHRDKMNKLGEIAQSFFQNPLNLPNYVRANIIQHPTKNNARQPKRIVFRDNQITHTKHFELHYKSYTGKGSSGSPALDDFGNFIGLHRGRCNWIEQKLSSKASDLKKEIQIFFASKPEFTLTINASEFIIKELGIYKSSSLEFIEELIQRFPEFIDDDFFLKVSNFSCAEFSEIIQKQVENLANHNLGDFLGIKDKAKLWACQFLRRLSGEITKENMEKTLRVKSTDFREKLQQDLDKEHKGTFLILHHDPIKNNINWIIKGIKSYNGDSIQSLLEIIQQKFHKIVINKDIVLYARNFLKNNFQNILEDIPEKHVFCNTAVLATKILENLNSNKIIFEKIPNPQPEKKVVNNKIELSSNTGNYLNNERKEEYHQNIYGYNERQPLDAEIINLDKELVYLEFEKISIESEKKSLKNARNSLDYEKNSFYRDDLTYSQRERQYFKKMDALIEREKQYNLRFSRYKKASEERNYKIKWLIGLAIGIGILGYITVKKTNIVDRISGIFSKTQS